LRAAPFIQRAHTPDSQTSCRSCAFSTAHTFHQTFGPDSFFLSENQQGATSFQENPPTSKPTVTFPLRRGTAAGHLVYYVITDASDRTVAQSLGVNFTPKLANAAGTSAVQRSSSSDPTSISVSADVDFSPAHVALPGRANDPGRLLAQVLRGGHGGAR